MNRTEHFISSLEDFELSFLKKHKLQTYLKPTQQKILNEVKKRSLTEGQQERLINERENNKQNTGCPRCNSQKIGTDQIDLVKGSGGYGYKIVYLSAAKASGHDLTSKGKRMVCEICGYILQDDNKQDSAIKAFFLKLIRKLKS